MPEPTKTDEAIVEEAIAEAIAQSPARSVRSLNQEAVSPQVKKVLASSLHSLHSSSTHSANSQSGGTAHTPPEVVTVSPSKEETPVQSNVKIPQGELLDSSPKKSPKRSPKRSPKKSPKKSPTKKMVEAIGSPKLEEVADSSPLKSPKSPPKLVKTSMPSPSRPSGIPPPTVVSPSTKSPVKLAAAKLDNAAKEVTEAIGGGDINSPLQDAGSSVVASVTGSASPGKSVQSPVAVGLKDSVASVASLGKSPAKVFQSPVKMANEVGAVGEVAASTLASDGSKSPAKDAVVQSPVITEAMTSATSLATGSTNSPLKSLSPLAKSSAKTRDAVKVKEAVMSVTDRASDGIAKSPVKSSVKSLPKSPAKMVDAVSSPQVKEAMVSVAMESPGTLPSAALDAVDGVASPKQAAVMSAKAIATDSRASLSKSPVKVVESIGSPKVEGAQTMPFVSEGLNSASQPSETLADTVQSSKDTVVAATSLASGSLQSPMKSPGSASSKTKIVSPTSAPQRSVGEAIPAAPVLSARSPKAASPKRSPKRVVSPLKTPPKSPKLLAGGLPETLLNPATMSPRSQRSPSGSTKSPVASATKSLVKSPVQTKSPVKPASTKSPVKSPMMSPIKSPGQTKSPVSADAVVMTGTVLGSGNQLESGSDHTIEIPDSEPQEPLEGSTYLEEVIESEEEDTLDESFVEEEIIDDDMVEEEIVDDEETIEEMVDDEDATLEEVVEEEDATLEEADDEPTGATEVGVEATVEVMEEDDEEDEDDEEEPSEEDGVDVLPEIQEETDVDLAAEISPRGEKAFVEIKTTSLALGTMDSKDEVDEIDIIGDVPPVSPKRSLRANSTSTSDDVDFDNAAQATIDDTKFLTPKSEGGESPFVTPDQDETGRHQQAGSPPISPRRLDSPDPPERKADAPGDTMDGSSSHHSTSSTYIHRSSPISNVPTSPVQHFVPRGSASPSGRSPSNSSSRVGGLASPTSVMAPAIVTSAPEVGELETDDDDDEVYETGDEEEMDSEEDEEEWEDEVQELEEEEEYEEEDDDGEMEVEEDDDDEEDEEDDDEEEEELDEDSAEAEGDVKVDAASPRSGALALPENEVTEDSEASDQPSSAASKTLAMSDVAKNLVWANDSSNGADSTEVDLEAATVEAAKENQKLKKKAIPASQDYDDEREARKRSALLYALCCCFLSIALIALAVVFAVFFSGSDDDKDRSIDGGVPTSVPDVVPTSAPEVTEPPAPVMDGTEGPTLSMTLSPIPQDEADSPTGMPVEPLTGFRQIRGPFVSSEDRDFGDSLSFDGSILAAGGPALGNGFVEVYSINEDGDMVLTASPVDGSDGSMFGSAVDVVESFVAVGAPDQETDGSEYGGVFVYENVGLFIGFVLFGSMISGEITPLDMGGGFGQAVSIVDMEGRVRAVVGAPLAAGGGETAIMNEVGKVYTFERMKTEDSEWISLDVNPFVGSREGDRLGSEVALSRDGSFVLMSSPGSDLRDSFGSVAGYSWQDGEWALTFLTTGSQLSEGFGSSLEILGTGDEMVAIGSPGFGNRAGRIQVFEKQDDGAYEQVGDDLLGEFGEEVGKKGTVAGRTVDSVPTLFVGTSTGLVRRFDFDLLSNEWIQLEEPYDTGFTSLSSISLSGNELAVGGNSMVSVFDVPEENPSIPIVPPPIEAPVEAPVSTPSDAITDAPSLMESPTTTDDTITDAPISIPATSEPSMKETGAPVGLPVEVPVATPVEAPTEAPVSVPVVTEEPTGIVVETELPVSVPVDTEEPTGIAVETESPVSLPALTEEPTGISVETESPVSLPALTAEPTGVVVETDSPVSAPVDPPVDSGHLSWAQVGGPFTLTEGSGFGANSMALGPSRLAVGAPFLDRNVGAVQLFARGTDGTWVEDGVLTGDGVSSAFGYSLDLSADGLLVGAPFLDRFGAAYYYDARTLEQVGSTIRSNVTNGFFASAVAASNNRVLIMGATGANSFYIYTFENGDWQQHFSASGADEGDGLGDTVDISLDGTLACIGAPTAGYFSVYEKTGEDWFEAFRLSGPSYGSSVKVLSSTQIAVGAPDFDGGRGRIFVFERQNNGAYRSLGSLDGPAADSRLGKPNSLSGTANTVVAGLSDGTIVRYDWNGSSWTQITQTVDTTHGSNLDVVTSSFASAGTFAVGGNNEVSIYRVAF